MSEDKVNFEEAMKKLEKIVDELETGEHSLQESIARFEEGLKLGKSCKVLLEKAETRVKTLVEEQGGGLSEEEAPDEF